MRVPVDIANGNLTQTFQQSLRQIFFLVNVWGNLEPIVWLAVSQLYSNMRNCKDYNLFNFIKDTAPWHITDRTFLPLSLVVSEPSSSSKQVVDLNFHCQFPELCCLLEAALVFLWWTTFQCKSAPQSIEVMDSLIR